MEEHLAIRQDAGELAVDPDIGDVEHPLALPALQRIGVVDRGAEGPEPRREAHLRRLVECLVAEEGDAILFPGAANPGEVRRAQRPRQIDPHHFDPDRRRQWPKIEILRVRVVLVRDRHGHLRAGD